MLVDDRDYPLFAEFMVHACGIINIGISICYTLGNDFDAVLIAEVLGC